MISVHEPMMMGFTATQLLRLKMVLARLDMTFDSAIMLLDNDRSERDTK